MVDGIDDPPHICAAMFCEENLHGGKPFCKRHWQMIDSLQRLDILRAEDRERDRLIQGARNKLARELGYGEYL